MTDAAARGRLIVIKPDGATRTEFIDEPPELERLKEAVGGYIEVVPHFDTFDGGPCVAFCNELGKIEGHEYNPYATSAWRRALGFDPRLRGDYLVGAVAIVAGPRALLAGL